jgi:hypothetical protein
MLTYQSKHAIQMAVHPEFLTPSWGQITASAKWFYTETILQPDVYIRLDSELGKSFPTADKLEFIQY